MEEYKRIGRKSGNLGLYPDDLMIYSRQTRAGIKYALGYDRGGRQFPEFIVQDGTLGYIYLFLRWVQRGKRIMEKVEREPLYFAKSSIGWGWSGNGRCYSWNDLACLGEKCSPFRESKLSSGCKH